MVYARDPVPPAYRGVCVGDKGAPLVARMADGWHLYGIATWNVRCGETGWPSVFAEVAEEEAFRASAGLAAGDGWLRPNQRRRRHRGQPHVQRTASVRASRRIRVHFSQHA